MFLLALAGLAGLLSPAPHGYPDVVSPDAATLDTSTPGSRTEDLRVFRPHAEFVLPGFPRMTLYRTGSDDVATLRLSVPLEESLEEAGAGQLLRSLAQDRMDVLASRIGARVRVTRHGTALVYEVSGASQDLDFLGWILREGLAPPDAGRFEEVRRTAQVEVARRLETPQGVLALQVREALAPGSTPPQGTATALERMDPARLSAVWARTHRLDSALLVVVANLPSEVVLASITDLGLPEAGPDPILPPSPRSGEPRPRPEVIRLWLAEGWRIEEGRDPRALVAVRLISETIRNQPGDYELGVELWELGRRWALVLSGAAYPGNQQAMRSRVQGLLGETARRLTEEGVQLHSAEVQREFIDTARTPWGLAELVGQALDMGESPAQMEAMIEELSRMEVGDLRRFLESLSATTPVRQEVRP